MYDFEEGYRPDSTGGYNDGNGDSVHSLGDRFGLGSSRFATQNQDGESETVTIGKIVEPSVSGKQFIDQNT